MRTFILVTIMFSFTALKAQSFAPGTFMNNNYPGIYANNMYQNDSSAKKWSLSKYGGLSTSFFFVNGRSTNLIYAPIGLQLNRRLTNNLYAFAGISATPAYVSFNRSFIANGANKSYQNSSPFKTGSFGIYSRAELGLQYVNDEKTSSISGSIGIERSSYPLLRYDQPSNQNATRILSPNR